MVRLKTSEYLLIQFIALFILFEISIEADFHLTVLHTSNIKGRFEPEEDSINNELYGGMARVAHMVKKFREGSKTSGRHILYLDVGDISIGTIWTTIHRHRIVTEFMNALEPDAMCPGNHEFDFGIPGFIKFAENVTFPLVITNMKFNEETDVEKLVNRSVVLTINNIKVGFVGFLTTRANHMTNLKPIEIVDEVTAITEESTKLTEEGIKIIIALGHASFSICKRVAKFAFYIDIVVCGHENVFLYNGKGPSSEIPSDAYPRRVSQKYGKMIPVVHAFAFTKYLGHLDVTFDDAGDIKYSEGAPIYLGNSTPEDPDALKLLEKFRPEVVALNNIEIGKSIVQLESYCREKECNYGNLAVDAFVRYRFARYTGTNWTDASVALMNAGALRLQIGTTLRQINVYKGNIHASFPYQHHLYLVEISGEDLIHILQISAQAHATGGFLMTSGLKITYEQNPALSPKLKSALIKCTKCKVPEYLPIHNETFYKFITTQYLVDGGDGYHIIKNKAKSITKLEILDIDAIIEYFKVIKYVMPCVEERVVFKPQVLSDGQPLRQNFILLCSIVYSCYILLLYIKKL